MNESDELSEEIKAMKYLRPHRHSSGYAITKAKDDFRSKCDAGLPIPPKRLWIGYGNTDEEYIASGKRHLDSMMQVVRSTSFEPFQRGNRVLDFGCGAGRMLRHLSHFADDCEIYGCDVSGDHIIWAKQYLSPPFRFFINTVIPHLPFADGFFDFVYCGSVFSHIDDLADTWLCELRRVVKVGGRLLISIHDENTVSLLRGMRHRLAEQMDSDPVYKKYADKYDMLVINRGTWSQVFYDTRSIAQYLDLLGLEVLKMEPRAYGYQTGICLTPKP